jgi:hypothetical protein
MLPGDGDQIAPVRPCCGPCPLPGPDRDALARYLASSPGWKAVGRRRGETARVWQNQAASVRILVPVPGAPALDDDDELLRHAALKVALVALGIPARSEWRAAFRLAAVTALHHEHRPGTCRCGLPHPCPTYLAATTPARGELPRRRRAMRTRRPNRGDASAASRPGPRHHRPHLNGEHK